MTTTQGADFTLALFFYIWPPRPSVERKVSQRSFTRAQFRHGLVTSRSTNALFSSASPTTWLWIDWCFRFVLVSKIGRQLHLIPHSFMSETEHETIMFFDDSSIVVFPQSWANESASICSSDVVMLRVINVLWLELFFSFLLESHLKSI